jgi:hypothetical protein
MHSASPDCAHTGTVRAGARRRFSFVHFSVPYAVKNFFFSRAVAR